jgi:hypothetical protein
MMFPAPGKYAVLFPGQYSAPDKVSMCLVDRHGVWRRENGMYMPPPKFVASDPRCALVCKPDLHKVQ